MRGYFGGPPPPPNPYNRPLFASRAIPLPAEDTKAIVDNDPQGYKNWLLEGIVTYGVGNVIEITEAENHDDSHWVNSNETTYVKAAATLGHIRVEIMNDARRIEMKTYFSLMEEAKSFLERSDMTK
jgi:hypothetical protein